MKKIDAHMHINFSGFNEKKLIDYLDKNEIEACWLLSWEEKNPELKKIYEYLPVEQIFDAYQKYPERIIPFYAPDPEHDNLDDIFMKYETMGLKGCGELKVTYKWKDGIIGNYLSIVNKHNLPLLFHMEVPRKEYIPPTNSTLQKVLDDLLNGAMNGVTKYFILRFAENFKVLQKYIEKHQINFSGYLFDFDALEQRVAEFPNIIFVGHGPHFWNNISAYLSPKYTMQKGKIESFGIIDKLLENYDNMYCDVSGKSGFTALTRDKEAGRKFLKKHYKKLFFGTDNTHYGHDSLLLQYGLSDEELERIFYQNAFEIMNK